MSVFPAHDGLAAFRRLAPGAGRAAVLSVLGKVLARHDSQEGARVARILFTGLLGLDFTQVITDPGAPVAGRDLALLLAAAQRFLGGEPPGRILGSREFWGMNFRLGPDTLEPRPDTETLVETALRRLAAAGGRSRDAEAPGGFDPDAPRRILDLGAGTGCILIALLSELPGAFGIGVDLAPGAARVARMNADANGVGGRCAFIAGDWAGAIGGVTSGAGGAGGAPDEGAFDLVVSNPPYIEQWALAGLPAGVRLHDPVRALDGGFDGLGPYRLLVPEAMRLLRRGGVVALEVGAGQAADVTGMLRAAGFDDVGVTEDLARVMRVVSGRR